MSDAEAQVGVMAAEAMGLLIDAVKQIPPEGWDQPSNLEGWTVRDLVAHVTGSAAKIVTLAEGGEIWKAPSKPADWKCEDPAARLRELAAQLTEALPRADLDAMRTSPQGEVPLRRALTYPVSDLALHGWDVYRSRGQLVELPEGLLAFCREFVESLPQDMLRRPGGFAPAQPVPEDATPTARLMAHLGRSVDPDADPVIDRNGRYRR
ncbi:MAG: TIGR03086 family protein [Mycobacterium sp.]|nr:TIGR03086 family protein [Mycobacterium sp.]